MAATVNHESVDAVYILHVLTITAPGSCPPHINARSLSSATIACAYRPGDGMFVFDTHEPPLNMSTSVGVVNPPNVYTLPLSVTNVCAQRALGSDTIGDHDVTPTFDCSHDDKGA
jgi:hypothetical protein